MHLGLAVVEMTARGTDTGRAAWAHEIAAINVALTEIEEPVRASPPATITLGPSRDLVRRRSRQRGGIRALFRAAARSLWGQTQIAVRPILRHRLTRKNSPPRAIEIS